MAVAVVQRLAKGSSGAVASLSLAAGDGWATPAAGNLLIVFGNSDATITMTTSGFTAGPSVIDGNGAYAWYKLAAGTESTITITPGGSARTTISAIEVSGASLPIDASNSSTIAGSNGLVTSAASVTTTAAGDFIAGAALLHSYSVASPSSPSWTNSFTNTLSASSTPVAGSVDVTTFVGELIAGAAGSYSTVCSWTTNAGDRQHIIMAFKAAAGGTAFTRTVDDPVGLSDTATAVSTFARTATDSAGLADTAAAVSTFVRVQTDSSGLTDSVAPAAAFTRSATDSSGLTDSADTVSAFARAASDDAGLTDAASALSASGFTRTVDDSVGLTDTQALARSATITDTAGFTDVVALARTATVTDAAGLTDARALAGTATVVDGAGLTDSVSAQLAAAGTRQIDDTTGLTDQVTVASTQTLTDSLGLVDAATLAVAAARDATDALGITDTAAVSMDRAAVATDAAGLTDAVSVNLTSSGTQVLTITDSIGLDSAFRIRQTTHRLSSGVTVRLSSGMTSRYPLVPD